MQNLFQKMDAYDINQKLCNETTLTNGFLVRCYLEIDSFNVSTYLTLFNACVFIPWIVYVIVKTFGKMDKTGVSMLTVSFCQQVLMLAFSIMFLIQD